MRRGRRSSGEESGFGSGGSALSGYPPSSRPLLWLTGRVRRRSPWGVSCARGLSHFHKAPPGLDREATMGKPAGVLRRSSPQLPEGICSESLRWKLTVCPLSARSLVLEKRNWCKNPSLPHSQSTSKLGWEQGLTPLGGSI